MPRYQKVLASLMKAIYFKLKESSLSLVASNREREIKMARLIFCVVNLMGGKKEGLHPGKATKEQVRDANWKIKQEN